MKKLLIISEQDAIAALLENDRVVEFFVNRGELLLGDIYTATVENILPGIDAAFVNLGKDKMGFLHANDIPGQGPLKERLVPKQKLLVQITKEPTGHKGPRVSTAISLPGRFLVLVPEERGISISRRISEARERARLKATVSLIKPPGVGLIIRTEAKGQGEPELFEDFEELWDRWQTIVSNAEASIGPTLIYRDQDLLYRVIRDAYSTDIQEIIVDSQSGQKRAQEYLSGWTGRQTQVVQHLGGEPLLASKNIDREIEAALSDRVELPSGGHLNIQPTEALCVIDVNSGRFTSSRTQAETVRRTNLEAAAEIPRQLRLRNVGGMVIVDFIDMESRKDQQQVLEAFQRALEDDRAKPQVGQLSDLGLVELTRRRQGQSLRELFTSHCPTCSGLGVVATLEIGTADGRRLISAKPRAEENTGKGRSSLRRPGKIEGTLRAATITAGKVTPTLVDTLSAHRFADENLSEVPEEILAQMPDDLLDQPETGHGFSTMNHLQDQQDDLDGPHAAAPASSQNPLSGAVYQEGEEQSSGDDLSHAVWEAEKVRQELETLQLPPKVSESSPQEIEDAEETESLDTTERYSPFEAEPEPITGVFRLKAKESSPESREASGQEDEESEAEPPSALHRGLGEPARVMVMNSAGDPTYSQPKNPESSAPPKGSWWQAIRSQQLGLPFGGSSSNPAPTSQESDTHRPMQPDDEDDQ